MSYKITIEKIETIQFTGKNWVCKYTDEVFKQMRKDYAKDNNIHWYENQPDELKQYHYVKTESERNERTTLLEQTVEELDFKKVIQAVNGI